MLVSLPSYGRSNKATFGIADLDLGQLAKPPSTFVSHSKSKRERPVIALYGLVI
jgi:hypothetical protein